MKTNKKNNEELEKIIKENTELEAEFWKEAIKLQELFKKTLKILNDD